MNIENTNVKDVFKVIEARTAYRFFYNDELVDLNRKVNIDIENTSVEDVLEIMFANSETGYTLMENNMVVIAPKRVLQQNTVTGTVTDALTGEPLPGVYVLIQGTQTGGVTDVNGRYSVNVLNSDAVLQFSSVRTQPADTAGK